MDVSRRYDGHSLLELSVRAIIGGQRWSGKGTPLLEPLLAFDPELDLLINGQSLLSQLVVYGDAEGLNALLCAGGDPKLAGELGLRALHFAAASRTSRALEQLLRHGANADAQDQQGWTALHHAIEHSNLNRLQRLLTYGADPNIANNRGQTALHLAVTQARESAIALLIEHGADTTLADADGNCPGHLGRIWKASVPNVRSSQGKTPLHTAVIAQRAIPWGYLHINAKDDSGKTALHYAISAKNHEQIKELLDAGASLRIRDKQGITPGAVAQQPGWEGVRAEIERRQRAVRRVYLNIKSRR
ncbi:MAG: ankyrin repeat protein [Rhodothermales bacterium]